MPEITCVICRKKVGYAALDQIPWRPFCSERCKLVDLGKWLSGEYCIAEPLTGQDPDPPPPTQ